MELERIRHIMTDAVLSIDRRAPITDALQLFAEHPLHHLPVVDGQMLVGMISSADVLRLEPPSNVESLMRHSVVTAQPDDTIAGAAARMSAHGIHALPVVDENGHLAGIVTTTDIMFALMHGVRDGVEPADLHRKPQALESLHAIRAARSAIRNGTDVHGMATSLLYLHRRNELLEDFRQTVARFLRSGLDPQLHTRLVREAERLEPDDALPLRL